MTMVFCRSCSKELHETAPTCVRCGALQAPAKGACDDLPAGVRGWCWGGFLLGWVWAVGNRTWWGLLALIPYVNIGVAIWLGMRGREMAWKNNHWNSVEHFNRVQRTWTQVGLGIVVVVTACVFYAAYSLGPSRPGALSEDVVSLPSPEPTLAAQSQGAETAAPAL